LTWIAQPEMICCNDSIAIKVGLSQLIY